MWRYTRSSPGHALISLRHPKTRAIDEGIELNFKDPRKMHEWFQFVFKWTQRLVGSAFPPLVWAVMVASDIEKSLFKHIDESVLCARVKDDIQKNAEHVVLSGEMPDDKLKAALNYIEELIKINDLAKVAA